MKKKAIRRRIERVCDTLQHMVLPRGEKAPASRKEVAALAYGLSMGLGLGYIETSRGGVMAGEDPIADAARILAITMEHWADGERDRMLGMQDRADAEGRGYAEVSVLSGHANLEVRHG